MRISARLSRLEREAVLQCAAAVPDVGRFFKPWDPTYYGQVLNILADAHHLDRVEGCFDLLSSSRFLAHPMSVESAQSFAENMRGFVAAGGAKDFRAFLEAVAPAEAVAEAREAR